MDAIIRVEPIKATLTVTEAEVSVVISGGARMETSALVPLVIAMPSLSLGGCSVTAIPNPNLLKKRGELAVRSF
jgi:hypothetical protein